MTNEIMAENFPEMVQVMYQQIEDSQHIPSRVTKNTLNLDVFSQSCDDRTPALGSRGLCTPTRLPPAEPAPLASEPGSLQAQGLAGVVLGPPQPRPLLRAAYAPFPASCAQWLLPCPARGRGGGPCIPAQSLAWLGPLCPQPQEASWVRVLPLTLCGPCQAHCLLWT